MNQKEKAIKDGFSVIETDKSENKLLHFLKEHYPTLIRDSEINLNELKAAAGLPVDEKVNGYGLNFVGRNFARAKYSAPTEKELKVNKMQSKNFEITKNLVLKGDNLDSLKILKSHYAEKIKCIYIDPPYNTTNDNFVYPDKFDKEEAEILGLQNMSEEDFARMDFSFKTKKSHNGWLSFMYPRLLLARDLLSKDGVIFISIDDNEQANLKLLCDEIFGEENFVNEFIWKKKQGGGNDSNMVVVEHEYILAYCKNVNQVKIYLDKKYKLDDNLYPFRDRKGDYGLITLDKASIQISQSLIYEIMDKEGNMYFPRIVNGKQSCWRWSKSKVEKDFEELVFKNGKVYTKYYRPDGITPKSLLIDALYGRTESGNDDIKSLFGISPFSYPKPVSLISHFISITTKDNDIILDFFAGSGTTGHAVMQLNAEDGGNRKFILCQINEPISKDKPAYKFCKEQGLEPVISSITIERLNRAGAKIASQIEEESQKNGLFHKDEKQISDIGFKVFDSVEKTKLALDGEEIGVLNFEKEDSLSKIYNMIFSVGIDEPTSTIEIVQEDCIYKIGKNYYIINSEKLNQNDFSEILKTGKIFIDGWTANLNTTLHNYKEDVKIVF